MFKRAKTMTWLAGLFFALSGFLAGGALAGISATKHNLSSSGTGTIKSSDQPEICIFCHTPHDAIKTANIPLWNKTLSATGINYGIYTSPTMNASDVTNVGMTVAADATVTNLCLSCHDGTVAINNFKNPSNMNGTTTMVNTTGGMLPAGLNSNLGTDLTNDHPVNFTYDNTLFLADGSLYDPGANGINLTNGVKLFSNKVQCASCHDPHTSAVPTFLRASMSGSTLCLSCHNK